jgi:hypothetical protein
MHHCTHMQVGWSNLWPHVYYSSALSVNCQGNLYSQCLCLSWCLSRLSYVSVSDICITVETLCVYSAIKMGRLGESKSALISTRRAIFCIQHDLLKKFWPQEFAQGGLPLGIPLSILLMCLLILYVCSLIIAFSLPGAAIRSTSTQQAGAKTKSHGNPISVCVGYEVAIFWEQGHGGNELRGYGDHGGTRTTGV